MYVGRVSLRLNQDSKFEAAHDAGSLLPYSINASFPITPIAEMLLCVTSPIADQLGAEIYLYLSIITSSNG